MAQLVTEPDLYHPRPTRSILLIFFQWFLTGGGNRSTRRKPLLVQVGIFNLTDMPDGSGQHLTVATIVPRLSRRATWPT